MIKRSQRCRKCEHNLSKPEYNPTSIKFKIQLAAYYHIPEIIVYKLANNPLVAGSECDFILKLSNPTQHPTNVEFMDLKEYLEFKKAKEEAEIVEKESKESEKPVSDNRFKFPYVPPIILRVFIEVPIADYSYSLKLVFFSNFTKCAKAHNNFQD